MEVFTFICFERYYWTQGPLVLLEMEYGSYHKILR